MEMFAQMMRPVFQTQLDESQIDPAFKNLFRQLAGPVGWTSASKHTHTHAHVCSDDLPVFVPTGHGDQPHGAADHTESDHEQTLVTAAVGFFLL